MALRERLVQLLAEKWDGNQSCMSEGCGLKRTHIGILLRRLQTDPQASSESETLGKIAKGSGVSLAWLVGGEGPIASRHSCTIESISPSRPSSR